MKSVEQRLSETYGSLKGAGQQSFVTELIAESGPTLEQKLNRAIEKCKELNIVIAESRRVQRKNYGTHPAAKRTVPKDRITQVMEGFRLSYRESCVYLGLPDPGKDVTDSDSVVKERAERWRRYCGSLTEAECMKLARKRIEP